MDTKLAPVTMADADGARIYRRSLTFLLSAAFSDLFPKNHLTIDHSVSSGGYSLPGDRPSTPQRGRIGRTDDVDARVGGQGMSLSCRQEVCLPKQPWTISKAWGITIGPAPEHRQKDYVTLYQLDDYQDYHQGYMVPSTGYIKWFDLLAAGDGFIRASRTATPRPSYRPCRNTPSC